MFTLSPYNDFDDLRHVARVCKENGVFLRVGIYNNIPFFDTIEDAPGSVFGQYKNDEVLTYSKAKTVERNRTGGGSGARSGLMRRGWLSGEGDGGLYRVDTGGGAGVCGELRLYPVIPEMGDGEIAAGLSFHYGQRDRAAGWGCSALSASAHAVGECIPGGLDAAFNSAASRKVQQHHSQNCNQCWVAYHRKYDVALYREL